MFRCFEEGNQQVLTIGRRIAEVVSDHQNKNIAQVKNMFEAMTTLRDSFVELHGVAAVNRGGLIECAQVGREAGVKLAGAERAWAQQESKVSGLGAEIGYMREQLRELHGAMSDCEQRVAATITGQFEQWARRFEQDHPPHPSREMEGAVPGQDVQLTKLEHTCTALAARVHTLEMEL